MAKFGSCSLLHYPRFAADPFPRRVYLPAGISSFALAVHAPLMPCAAGVLKRPTPPHEQLASYDDALKRYRLRIALSHQ